MSSSLVVQVWTEKAAGSAKAIEKILFTSRKSIARRLLSVTWERA